MYNSSFSQKSNPSLLLITNPGVKLQMGAASARRFLTARLVWQKSCAGDDLGQLC